MPRRGKAMAIEVVSIPIAANMSQVEQMINDADGQFKKRVQWAGEAEKAELLTLDKLLSDGFKIVDVQETKANNFGWLRYTLHQKPKKSKKVRGETRFLEQVE
jgi:hypothetical protein